MFHNQKAVLAMRIRFSWLLIAAVVILFSSIYPAAVVAQESDPSAVATQAFQLRTISKPADPDPTTQSTEGRTKTIRNRIVAAKALLDSGDHKTFFNDYVDPFWLARAAAGQEVSVDDLLTKQVIGDPNQIKAIAQRFGQVLEQSLKVEPKWLLNGRAASFMTGRSSHTAEFWVYFDGKWRISPET